MNFSIKDSTLILENSPKVIKTYLENIPEKWIYSNEGENTWSPFDVLGHLIHGEKTDWIPRLKIILGQTKNKDFIPFDRFAQFENSKGTTIQMLHEEFSNLRIENVNYLNSLSLSDEDLLKKGTHPEFGAVTLKQLLSTWVVHDQSHIAQISRVLAKQYKNEVGPWINYIPILKK